MLTLNPLAILKISEQLNGAICVGSNVSELTAAPFSHRFILPGLNPILRTVGVGLSPLSLQSFINCS